MSECECEGLAPSVDVRLCESTDKSQAHVEAIKHVFNWILAPNKILVFDWRSPFQESTSGTLLEVRFPSEGQGSPPETIWDDSTGEIPMLD